MAPRKRSPPASPVVGDRTRNKYLTVLVVRGDREENQNSGAEQNRGYHPLTKELI